MSCSPLVHLLPTPDTLDGTPWKLPPLTNTVENGCRVHYRICYGADGTGDIYRWENVVTLQLEIQSDLHQRGSSLQDPKVHLVMADGGFDAQRDSECQEELTQKLIVCQVAAALSLLIPGGTLVVKMFGFQTSTVRRIMTSLSELFQELVVVKPISSRPASSERYVVAAGFLGVDPGWDGQRWRDKMLLGDWNCRRKPVGRSIIDRFLDDCDRDLLTLNLKACFSILSCLERKTEALSSGDGGSYHWRQKRPMVNVETYKNAWRLS
jgi:cap1 methyltransferase